MDDFPIAASGIAFAYGKPVVHDFSTTVRPGEAVALLGPNGAGKTTVLRMLCGDLKPRSGRLAIMGGDPRRPAVRRSMGVVRELPALNDYLTVAESLRYTLDIHGAPRTRRAAIGETLARFGLKEAEKRRIAALSKGMMRRLELAQVVLVDPPAWILDEPDSGLDPGGARLFRAEIAAAKDRGRAILFSSHSVLDATVTADRIVVMRGGHVAFEGSKDAVMERLDRRAFVATGGGPALAARLAGAAEQEGATLSGPEIPVADLEEFLFQEPPG